MISGIWVYVFVAGVAALGGALGYCLGYVIGSARRSDDLWRNND